LAGVATTSAKWFSPGDLLAGISVSFVVIPQSIAYAELAGMPPYTGLLAAALPSIAAAFFVSSPYLQTGPVALTSLLTFGVLTQLAVPGTTQYISLAASLALVVGIFRIAIGLLRLGQIAFLISQPVLQGFTSAAALLIICTQLPKTLGMHSAHRGVIEGALYSLSQPQDWFAPAAFVALASVLIILLGRKIHRAFPGTLIAVVLGLALSVWLPYQGSVVGEIPTAIPSLTLQLPWSSLPGILLGGLIIALVGFAEPSSIARQYAILDRIPWSSNREFISQGVANVTSGLIGGFPVGGSFSRTSINRLSGGRTRASGLITGCVVLAFAPFSHILSQLPTAVLGAVVITAVLSLMNFTELWHLHVYSKPQAIIGWLTFVACLALAPRIDVAILLGIGVAVGHHLRREQQLVIDSWVYDNAIHIKPKGVLWFGSIANFEVEFRHLLSCHREAERVVVQLEGLGRIDLSAAISLSRLVQDAEKTGMEVSLENVPPMAKAWTERLWKEPLKQ
jgi:SulP family sulfate permease